MTVKRITPGKLEKIKIPTEYEGLTNVYFDAVLKTRVVVSDTQPAGEHVLAGAIWRNTSTNPHTWFQKMPNGSWVSMNAGTTIGGIKQHGLITAAQNDLITSLAIDSTNFNVAITNLQNDKLNKVSQTAVGSWDNYKTPGYYDGTGLANAPVAGEWFYVQVQAHSLNPGMWVVQTAISFSSTTSYVRSLVNGAWTAWSTIAMNLGTLPNYGCRAFGAHNPNTATSIIKKNITTIARIGAGLWRFTFETPFIDANYAAITSMNQVVAANVSQSLHTIINSRTATYCDVRIVSGGNTGYSDWYADYISLAVFA